MPDTPALPAAASVAVRALLRGPSRPARVLGVFPSAVYLATHGHDDVVALVAADGVRLPCALVVAAPARARPFARVRPGDAARVGGGGVGVGAGAGTGGVQVAAARWWDPRPRVGCVAPDVLVARVRAAEGLVGPPLEAAGDTATGGPVGDAGAAALTEALARLDRPAAARAASGLVGLGSGLTPAGDDFLAGILAAVAIFAAALEGAGPAGGRGGAGAAAAVADHVAAAVLASAPSRTPLLSAALLAHAARGEVAAPVAMLCSALVGRGPLDPAVAGLVAVGHSSGVWLARGVLAGARAAVAARPGGGVLGDAADCAEQPAKERP